jgi:cob(I)alamin adenosyltransferase
MTQSGKKSVGTVQPAHSKKTTAVAALANRGLVIVITGNGKGKTTSAFGQALRAVGQGYKVFIMQFMKGRDYGEFVAAKKYLPRLTVRRSGLDSFVMRDKPAPVDIELARQGFELAKKAIASGKFNLIPLEEMIRLIKNKPPGLDLILTGRYAAKAIIKLADTVSEVKEIKHHYAAGIKDRAGIEY